MTVTTYGVAAVTAREGWVIDLGTADPKALPIVGGKAANLGELIRAGLPVPAGFCVMTRAYAEFAAAAEIPFDALDDATGDDLIHLASVSRQALLTARVPGQIARSVVEAYSRLGRDVPVAVRSSATAEDLPFASFAGQQDTYLNIVGADAVVDAVRRCWASLWTDRAVVYRRTNGIDHRTVRLAVVVQRMIQAEVAGVLFTANPVTGRRRQAVIDASPGLGEAVVSGAVNPDHFVVQTETGDIVERRLGDKQVAVRSLPGGGTRTVEMTSASDRACITDDQVRSLASLGERVEEHFGAPQDTEWAIDAAGTIWLTQARPITTLFPLPTQTQANTSEFRVYFCFSVAQGLYRPLTPMGLSAFRTLASAAARLLGFPPGDDHTGPSAYAEAGQRVFMDLTGTLRGPVGRVLMPRVLDVMEARSAAILRELIEDPRLSVTHPSRLPFVRRLLRIMVRYRVPVWVLQALLRPEAAQKRAERVGTELMARLAPPETTDLSANLDFVEHVLRDEVISLGPNLLPVAAAGLGMLGLAGKLLGDDASTADLQTILRGLPHNITTQMDLSLWKLATAIRADESATSLMRAHPPEVLAERFREGLLPQVIQLGMTRFLGQYGHRAVAEIDIGMPRWSEDPTHIFGVLMNYLRLEQNDLAPDAMFARGAADAEAMVEILAARASRRSRLRGRLVRFALNRARQLAGLRELPKYYMITALSAVRRQLAAIGEQLALKGCIASADDLFFLDLAEVRAAIHGKDLHDRVAERRQTYQLELRRRQVPNVLLSDGTAPENRRSKAGHADLIGTPASAGTVTGVARVIHDPVGAHLEPGEILVAPSTDPGWTPLFLTAGGLVMEMGGANSHGAVVAREYGIPAVVGVPDATLRITNGQSITVDGSSGSVSVQRQS